MLSSTLSLLLVGLVAATPVDPYPRCNNNRDLVFYAAQALRLSPKGQKYCAGKVAPVTQTVTVGVTRIAQVTNTALSVATVKGGTVTITASPVVVVQTQTNTAVATITSSTCPGPVKRAPTDGKDDCPDAPIRGYLCELVNYACQCLNLPASTKKVTVTNTLVATAVVTKTIGSTTTIVNTATTTPTIIQSTTVTSTSTVCVTPSPVAPPPVVVPGRPTTNTCSPGTTCGNVFFCGSSDTCVCLISVNGFNACGNTALDQGCGAQKPCVADADCGATEICITACCDTTICYATDGCVNTALPRRLFRIKARAGAVKELPPSFRPQGGKGGSA